MVERWQYGSTPFIAMRLSLVVAVTALQPAVLPGYEGNLVTPSIKRCFTYQLGLDPVGRGGGAGHLGILFRLTNRSHRACTLYGYPGVLLLDARRHPMPTHLRWSNGYLAGSRPRRLVHLPPRKSAYFLVEWVHFPTTGQTCRPARFLRITPPNDHRGIVVRAGRVDACGGNVTASPVEPARFAF